MPGRVLVPPAAARPLGLLLGYVADLAFGDPRRGHPVAGLGRAMAALERRLYADRRSAGVWQSASPWASTCRRRPPPTTCFVTGRFCGPLSLPRRPGRCWAAGRCGPRPRPSTASCVVVIWPAARVQITHLVGRDPSALDEAGIARACVESVAENTSDAVVGPLFWGAVAGLPGLVGYRTINTLDAMIGHRSPRYLRFGWAAARLDDVANLLPARLSAAVVLALAPLFGGSSAEAWRVVRRDARRHPSPNAGPVEAAFAGALGITLGGVNTYGDTVEDRGTLGDGPSPRAGGYPAGGPAVRGCRWGQRGPGGLAAAGLSRDRPASDEPSVSAQHGTQPTAAVAPSSTSTVDTVGPGSAGRRTTTTGTPSSAAAVSFGAVSSPPESLVTSTSMPCSAINERSPSTVYGPRERITRQPAGSG